MATLAKTYWKDSDGRKHRQYLVRVCDDDGGASLSSAS
jgi:hypothetical protein